MVKSEIEARFSVILQSNKAVVLEASATADEFRVAGLLYHAIGDDQASRRMFDNALSMLLSEGDNSRALNISDIILALFPASARDLNRNGLLAQKNALLLKAEASFIEAIRKGSTAAKYNLSDLYSRLYRLKEAVFLLNELRVVDAKNPAVHSKLADCYIQMSDFESARTSFSTALSLKPDEARLRNRYGQFLMMIDDYGNGLEEYEWRTRLDKNRTIRKLCVGPAWNGESLAGKVILVYREQGIGDNIQFVRYLADLRSLGGKVIYRCNPQLLQLFKECGVADEYVVSDAEIKLLQYDYHASVMSLPLLFFRKTGRLNLTENYLWRERKPVDEVFFDPNSLKVGVVWKGGEGSSNNRKRNLRPEYLTRLLSVRPAQFFSLQLARENQEISGLAVKIQDLSSLIRNFHDTARIIQSLDVVLTVDTAVAHLAGALGKKTFLLLQYVPDFRWGLGCDVALWYPSVRLFREIDRKEDGNWDYALDCAVSELKKLTTCYAV